MLYTILHVPGIFLLFYENIGNKAWQSI